MTRIISGMTVSLDGYIAGPNDGRDQPLGKGGDRLFAWYSDGDTPSRLYPSFRLSQPSAEFFDEFASRCGAVITGRRTYDIANAWDGHGPLPGAPLFVLTHRIPSDVPDSDPPYTYVTGGIADAVSRAPADAQSGNVIKDFPGSPYLFLLDHEALRAGPSSPVWESAPQSPRC